jgi:16S rRNA A1518/A1519 N6-dimethyltransferase RsmA/KsgA/DIM1 with predicted DNA glycosylase/AP lyase activity
MTLEITRKETGLQNIFKIYNKNFQQERKNFAKNLKNYVAVKYLVTSSKITLSFSKRMYKNLTCIWKTIAAYCGNHTKHMHTLCE